MIKLVNKNILITGGAKGIGNEVTRKLSNKNKVFVIDNDSQACKQISKEMPSVLVFNEDVTNYDKISDLINKIFDDYGNIDILINNAAIQTVENILDLELDDWKRVIDVNLNSVFYLSKIVTNKMDTNGTVLNIISTHYNKPRVDKLHYDVSKSGVAMLTEGFAMALSNKGITVNALAIGATYTPMNANFSDKKVVEEALLKIPMKYICETSDVSEFICNILEQFSDKTTGTIFTIDGGRHLL